MKAYTSEGYFSVTNVFIDLITLIGVSYIVDYCFRKWGLFSGVFLPIQKPTESLKQKFIDRYKGTNKTILIFLCVLFSAWILFCVFYLYLATQDNITFSQSPFLLQIDNIINKITKD